MDRACDMSSLWFCFIAFADSVLCWYKLFLLTTRNSHLLLSSHACLSHSCTRSVTAERTCVSCPNLMLQPCMQWKNADLPWKWQNNQHIDYGCHMEEEEKKRPQAELQEGCLGLLFQVLCPANSKIFFCCLFLLCCTWHDWKKKKKRTFLTKKFQLKHNDCWIFWEAKVCSKQTASDTPLPVSLQESVEGDLSGGVTARWNGGRC